MAPHHPSSGFSFGTTRTVSLDEQQEHHATIKRKRKRKDGRGRGVDRHALATRRTLVTDADLEGGGARVRVCLCCD